ncbi:MAG TPA: Crp/Fnr family transcriptional regulator [Pyrinomonadaceae bacterium]|nr:Crp/Fnr family transcriptional regulator [Chloracidobacterium sp.]MBP9935006.1 Crp/Fnr family transcriptional regulator [Pyrinomonadaceae bacterium]MBK9436687.1 Crp/Fnr family transcriptional regulator [Chloracidobacterium sp.]HQX57092.1 Crp/Fnr family transcriptional regulator [Pyrinomonadaceae bacterium]HQY65747.1 Crp/Fnr family transcriptional regulator [Pyrinomonadaceae bacterium]
MKVFQDLRIQHKCKDCGIRGDGFFCDLPETDLRLFESIKITKACPKGTMLFVEGQPSTGVFLLCQGKVKISTCSPDGKVIILGIAEPGQMIGLSSVINGVEHETSAETLEMCQVDYIKTDDLMHLIQNNPQACLNAAKQLSRDYHTAYVQICALGLSDSVTDKLAKLFLSWSGNGTGGDGRVQLKNFFTHEEIAEMIGASRETVTRALRYFRERELVTLKGSDLVIHDRRRLKEVIGTRGGYRTDM